MKKNARLETKDRNFFALITEATFTNPFLDERDEILIQILPGITKDIKNRVIELTTIAPYLNERIDRLERKGYSRIQHFKGKDRQLLKNAFLLQVYLSFTGNLKELIQTQLKLGETPADVPFVEQVITQLKSRGLSDQESLHYLAIFYQLRRAFYFIDLALVGDSPSMQKLRLALWNNVFTSDARTYDRLLWNRMEDFSTILLIIGARITGKDVIP